jgi:ubiquitin-protein ligase
MEMATKRIQKEYENLLKDQLIGVHAEPTDPYDLYSWTASIKGPLETPY